MKKIWKKVKNYFRALSGQAIIGLILFVLAAIAITYFLGFRYVFAVIFFSSLFVFFKHTEKSESDKYFPWDLEKLEAQLSPIDQKIKITEEHLKEHPNDLDAQYKLIELRNEKKSIQEGKYEEKQPIKKNKLWSFIKKLKK